MRSRFILLLGLCTLTAAAHDGDNHDQGLAAPPAAALPRFAATSELFELVGVLDGRRLTLYLDRADDNAPVTDARVELELGAATLAPKPQGAGEFVVELPAAPAPGVIAITATVTTANDSDLLAGELDVHAPAAAPEAAAPFGARRAWFVGASFVALVAAAVVGRRLERRAARRAAA